MTSGEKQALAVAAVAVAAAAVAMLAAGGGVIRLSAEAGAVTDQAGWAPEHYGAAYDHLCQPGNMPRRLHVKHPLFRRPSRLGGDRAQAVESGWAWFADPPADEGL